MRDSVKLFAEAMEAKLKTHDEDCGERGWEEADCEYLKERLDREVSELTVVMDVWDKLHSAIKLRIIRPELRNMVKEECVDVANFAMMIFDNLSADEEDAELPDQP